MTSQVYVLPNSWFHVLTTLHDNLLFPDSMLFSQVKVYQVDAGADPASTVSHSADLLYWVRVILTLHVVQHMNWAAASGNLLYNLK